MLVTGDIEIDATGQLVGYTLDHPERLPGNVKRLLDAVNARPAAQRAEALKTQHAFKAVVDDEARRALFPQNNRLPPAPGA